MIYTSKKLNSLCEDDFFKYEKIFCENMKLFREKNNMTAWEMSEVSGLAYRDIERMEKGLMPDEIDLNCVFYLARYFGISPTEFFKDRNK